MGKVCRSGQGQSRGWECGHHKPRLPDSVCTSTPALQEKVAEVEGRLREQLSESERRLNEVVGNTPRLVRVADARGLPRRRRC